MLEMRLQVCIRGAAKSRVVPRRCVHPKGAEFQASDLM